jgi:hypothetical protein
MEGLDLSPGIVWKPTRNGFETYPRKLLGIDKSSRNSVYDRVQFRRVLADGSLGEMQGSYVSSWKSWIKKFAAERDGERRAPPFDSRHKGVQFYAKDGTGQWFYVNHANTWQMCPPPFPDVAA